MKKLLVTIFLIINLLFVFSYTLLYNTYKVHKIGNPVEIYLDLNKNLIFDEESPFTIQKIHYIGEKLSTDSYPFLIELTAEEKFFLNYMALRYANNLLNNKFVQIKDDELYIGNKKYSELMLESKFVFDDSVESQQRFIENIKNTNLDEYVILNTKSKKYHKLGCEQGLKASNYKIIKLTEAQQAGQPCKHCILNQLPAEKHISEENHIPSFNNTCNIPDSYKTDYITVYFIDLNKIFKPIDKCDSGACRALKNEIDSADSTIDFAIYGIYKQREILKALVNAQKRGVKIRWVFDFDKKSINYYQDSLELKKYLKNYNTDEIYEKENSSAIMHNKFFIFDNKKVWTGSANITNTDLTDFNANISVLINSKELAEKYTQEFNQMYDGLFHTKKQSLKTSYIEIDNITKIKPLFSPKDNIINNEIIPLISSAKKYIYIPVFFITHKELANELIAAHNRGVEIKIINDATNASNKYTTHKQLRNSGIKVKTENYAGKMHIKALIIDDKISVLGSMNLTKSANNKNDENVIIIENEEITKYLKSSFLYLWNKIPEKYEYLDPKAESLESIGSCFDGIDNDFDGKIDNMDEGCKIIKRSAENF